MPPADLRGDCVQLREFFRRKRLEFNSRKLTWEPARAVNIDEMLYAPVAAGMWKQHELWDGTYVLDDLWDILELMSVQQENERRSMDAIKETR